MSRAPSLHVPVGTSAPNPLNSKPTTTANLETRGALYVPFWKAYLTCPQCLAVEHGREKAAQDPGPRGGCGPSRSRLARRRDGGGSALEDETTTTCTPYARTRWASSSGWCVLSTPVGSIGVRKKDLDRGDPCARNLLFKYGQRISHQQRRGLTLEATRASERQNSAEVTSRRTDAGESIKNAKVKAKWNGQEKTCTTQAKAGASRASRNTGKEQDQGDGEVVR